MPFTADRDPLRGDSDVVSLVELERARALDDDDSDVTSLPKSDRSREHRPFDGRNDVVLLPESITAMRAQRRRLLQDKIIRLSIDEKRGADDPIRDADGNNLQRRGM